MMEGVKNRALSAQELEMMVPQKTFMQRLQKDFAKNWEVYLLIIPVLAFYAMFCYKPMYGALMAFQRFSPTRGIWGSTWVGFENFETFFTSVFFKRTLFNTLRISIGSLIFGFPAPIILALLINELKSKRFTKVIQTISYLPHFISLVVICGIIATFVGGNGVINTLLSFFGVPATNLLNNPKAFVPIYIISDIWQGVGWGSIIYLAAIAGIDQEMYEAAMIDGAGRWKQTMHITIPGLMPTITLLFILRLGGIMGVGFEKIILLYNPMTYETADVIASFVYRAGLLSSDYGYSTAVGLFNAVVNFGFVFGANAMGRKITGAGLW